MLPLILFESLFQTSLILPCKALNMWIGHHLLYNTTNSFHSFIASVTVYIQTFLRKVDLDVPLVDAADLPLKSPFPLLAVDFDLLREVVVVLVLLGLDAEVVGLPVKGFLVENEVGLVVRDAFDLPEELGDLSRLLENDLFSFVVAKSALDSRLSLFSSCPNTLS